LVTVNLANIVLVGWVIHNTDGVVVKLIWAFAAITKKQKTTRVRFFRVEIFFMFLSLGVLQFTLPVLKPIGWVKNEN